jgi:hypothetical protein
MVEISDPVFGKSGRYTTYDIVFIRLLAIPKNPKDYSALVEHWNSWKFT